MLLQKYNFISKVIMLFIEKIETTEICNTKYKTHERQRKKKERYHGSRVANYSSYT